MGRIITVLGEISPEELGCTTMHEHTLSNPLALMKTLIQSGPDMAKGIGAYRGGADLGEEHERRVQEGLDRIPQMSVKGVLTSMRMDGRNPAKKLKAVDYYVNEMKAFREAGGQSLCDCSPLPYGGVVPAKVQEISRKSGVHIVTAAGYYVRASIPQKLLRQGERALQDAVERYLEQGDPASGAKPGFVKCAVSCVENEAICAAEQMAVRSCARAAKKKGMCLHIHTAFPVRKVMILALAELLEKEIGLASDRVLFCHMDSYNIGMGNPCARINGDGYDLELPLELARRGFNIGLDTWSGSAADTEEGRFGLAARKKMLCASTGSGRNR